MTRVSPTSEAFEIWITGFLVLCCSPGPLIVIHYLCSSAGKKGPDLGEYDPLTQADSEDESEEDDLVLNYPRNGLGRDGRPGSGSAKLLGGRSGRHVGAGGEAPDDEEEEDEWRDRPTGKGTQYWSHRRSERDRTGEDGGGPGPLGGAGAEVHGTDAEEKRRRTRRAIRSAFFLVPLVCAASIVLLSAFLIPCQNANLQRRLQWERALGAAGGEGIISDPRSAFTHPCRAAFGFPSFQREGRIDASALLAHI